MGSSGGPSRGTNALLAALLVLLVAGLGVLAVLQYGWIDRVSDAERERMRANIDFAARRFTEELRAEIGEVFESFARPEGGDLGQRYGDWASIAVHPRLIANIYVIQRDSVRMLDLDSLQLVESTWPEALAGLRRQIESMAGPARWPPPFVADVPGLLIAPRRGPPPAGFEEMRDDRPAIFVQLDRAQLVDVILPQLAAQHFATGTDSYDVAVMRGTELLFRSDPSWPDGRTLPDVEVPFVAFEPAVRPVPLRAMAPNRPPMEPWRLLVRRRDAALETLVASARRRNLALSFGILFILAATVALLLALLRRADRLRAQQAQFVAAMTHELNTPIAALRAAGENLKDGIVADGEKLTRYGDVIVKESARLGDMVAQVLDFAGIQARANARASHEPVDVEAIVGEAVEQCRALDAEVTIETQVETDLPRVRGDAQALTRAIQNLVANAIRHGGSGGWVGVRVSRNGSGVAITVEDRGPGIDGRDTARLFEPFYRGRNSTRVRGAGLGLAIVQQIARAHGGSVDVDRKRRSGAAFTIHLPAETHRG
ncbi:MAG TPA: HAMP domain-containing sensor histidine kinase [Thermoanaerobaculia bacterium]|nr:HAMP domain-containing sensor histidine kinase [Thermoanaerobaculia bacterium]